MSLPQHCRTTEEEAFSQNAKASHVLYAHRSVEKVIILEELTRLTKGRGQAQSTFTTKTRIKRREQVCLGHSHSTMGCRRGSVCAAHKTTGPARICSDLACQDRVSSGCFEGVEERGWHTLKVHPQDDEEMVVKLHRNWVPQ